MATLAERFKEVSERINRAAVRGGRVPDDVTLIAVSKTVSYEAVLRSEELGQQFFGENRVDELARKRAHCPLAHFHFIGSLQTNKVRKVVGQVDLIHSVDSLHLLDAINARAEFQDIVQPVLLQVNIAQEESKHGFTSEEMRSVLAHAATLDHVRVEGLMTMAPNREAESVRWVFSGLRELCENLRNYARQQGWEQVQLTQLSMGMSNDYEVAIEEGATLVRVGSALYKEE